MNAVRKRILLVGHSDANLIPLCKAVLVCLCQKRDLHKVEVRSCGFWAKEGQVPVHHLVTVAGELGLDLAGHQAHYITEHDVEWADWILPQDEMIARGLKPFLNSDISKLGRPLKLACPSEYSLNAYRESRKEVTAICDKIVKKLTVEYRKKEKIGENIQFRLAQCDDIDTIADLEKKCFVHPWTYENIRDELEKKDACFWLAIHENIAVGYGSVAVVSQIGYMNNIAVLPDYRQMGIGEQLLRYIEEFCRQKQADSVTLEVRQKNIVAKNLYEKSGFVIRGSRPDFYRDPVDNADIMTKTLQ